MPTSYPSNANAVLSVDVLLKNPTLISRSLVSLVAKRLIADKVCAHGDPSSVAGGVMQYERSESIYMNQAAEEIATRGFWPRATSDDQIFTALVKQYGLEFPLNYLAIRRNKRDQLQRGLIRIANSVVKFIDSQLIAVLTDTTTYPTIQTQAASAAWGTVGTDIIGDTINAVVKIDQLDEGLAADTLILPVSHRASLVNNTGLRNVLPRENTSENQIGAGAVAPFLGLDRILYSNQLTGKAIVLQSGICATITDEVPDPQEGFVAYSTADPTIPPVWAKVWDDPNSKEKVVSAGRWPAIGFVEPRAVFIITGI